MIDRKAIDKRDKVKHPIRFALTDAKYRAKKKGMPFDIKLSDIDKPTHCPIFGMELDYTGGKKTGMAKNNAASLDRIIPELGYVKGNVIVISWRANFIKTNASIEELNKLAQFYVALHSNK